MRINVRAVPNSKTPAIIRIDEGSYRARVDAPATEGRANERLVEMLADHFGVSKSSIRILRGANARDKLVQIGE